jgi:hypothetical protein
LQHPDTARLLDHGLRANPRSCFASNASATDVRDETAEMDELGEPASAPTTTRGCRIHPAERKAPRSCKPRGGVNTNVEGGWM